MALLPLLLRLVSTRGPWTAAWRWEVGGALTQQVLDFYKERECQIVGRWRGAKQNWGCCTQLDLLECALEGEGREGADFIFSADSQETSSPLRKHKLPSLDNMSFPTNVSKMTNKAC